MYPSEAACAKNPSFDRSRTITTALRQCRPLSLDCTTTFPTTSNCGFVASHSVIWSPMSER